MLKFAQSEGLALRWIGFRIAILKFSLSALFELLLALEESTDSFEGIFQNRNPDTCLPRIPATFFTLSPGQIF